MHAPRTLELRWDIADRLAQHLQHDVLSFAVEAAHPPQVRGIGAAMHEFCEHHLLKDRDMPVDHRSGARKIERQVRWHYDESESERRQQRLGEGPDIDDAAIAISALHGGRRLASIMEIAVVIVLENPGAGDVREFDQRCPPLDRERRAQRILASRAKRRSCAASETCGALPRYPCRRYRSVPA